MSERKNIEKEIKLLEEEIRLLESKRSRSQAALIDALVSRNDPSESEMQFFRAFTAEINLKREQLTKLKKQLEK